MYVLSIELERQIFMVAQVMMACTINKIGDVDTLKQQFAADCLLECKWMEYELKGKTDNVCERDFFVIFLPFLV